MMIKEYRMKDNKSTRVPALQFQRNNWGEMRGFVDAGELKDGRPQKILLEDGKIGLLVPAWDEMRDENEIFCAHENDWIVKLTYQHFLIFKPEIFEAEYELIED